MLFSLCQVHPVRHAGDVWFLLGWLRFSPTVEANPAVTEGMTKYRFFVNMNDASDRMSAVFGNNEYTLSVETPEGAFNSSFNVLASASTPHSSRVPRIGGRHVRDHRLEGPASSSGLEGAADPSIVEDTEQPITPFFLTDGATSFEQHPDGLLGTS